MFGSYPCYPGFQDRLSYVGIHFYCSTCQGVVLPHEVSVVVVDSNGQPSGVASVLRCKNHPIRGTHSSGPLTTLWGLIPKDQEAVDIRERMSRICFSIRNLDIFTLLSSLGGGGCIFSGVVLCMIVASPMILGLPLWCFSSILCGVGFILCLLGVILNYYARFRLREWLRLSQDYIRCCDLIPVQKGTEKYVVLTEFPPSCHILDPLLAKDPGETPPFS
ncbi:hypothetical protein [Chlamydia avium]|uniref:Uncharacterized protein n=1 Tax=Chlamydia avium 10DC88 TaxID=1229831 RepID=W8JFJ0_9CHLA|nr:hypothetical protein [Chlamydia avium]AHK62965.1 Uncharacterized protein M832_00950 [Chlamydia avium 10DC88]